MASELFNAIFRPQQIALIGASPDATKRSSMVQRLLMREGYKGKIIPINPKYGEIMGIQAFASIVDVGGPIDHAFIMVPAAAVADVVRECCAAGVKIATIYSGGFAESGPVGARREQEILEIAARGGLRIIGPNCQGTVNAIDNILLTANLVFSKEPLRAGSVGVISQSGGLVGALLSRANAKGLRFSHMASIGNESDIGAGELAEEMLEDENTDALLLFLETFRDAPRLASAARRAHHLGKPIVVYKLGRSEVGRQAALSHTGAMLSGDDAAIAFLRDNGILRADTLEGFLELPRLVNGHTPPRGKRVAVLSTTGGGGGLIADRLGLLGSNVVPPSIEVVEHLAAQGINISKGIVTDLGGMSSKYEQVLRAFLASDHCDALVAVAGSATHYQGKGYVEAITANKPFSKPVACFLLPQGDKLAGELSEHGVGGIRSPEATADALHAYLEWRPPRERANGFEEDLASAQNFIRGQPRSRLNERDACLLFSTLGIEVAHTDIVTEAGPTKEYAGPMALKILSSDIPHKTDAGLVRLNVCGSERIRATLTQLLQDASEQFPEANIEGVLVAPMEHGVAEVIVGYRYDSEVGPLVLLGMGGVIAELGPSHAVSTAPINLEGALEMIDKVPALRAIRGFRNLPKGDVNALAEVLVSISKLACLEGRRVDEAEINPLIVRAEGEGAVAVDGLAVLEPLDRPAAGLPQ